MSVFSSLVSAKRLEIFRAIVPQAKTIAVLINPSSELAKSQESEIADAARALSQQIQVVPVTSSGEFQPAFVRMREQEISALIVTADPFFVANREQIIRLTQAQGIAAIYPRRDFVDDGGLMSYGPDLPVLYRQMGTYAGRFLKGEKAAELPVLLPTKYELVINGKVAKTLGVNLPDKIMAIADEVIE